MEIHKDERRILYDYANGNFKSAKAVEILEQISVGGHYHKNKDEEFLLMKGKFLELQMGDRTEYNIEAPYKVIVPRYTYHRFVCSKGSILLGTATEFFDPTDEYTENINIKTKTT